MWFSDGHNTLKTGLLENTKCMIKISNNQTLQKYFEHNLCYFQIKLFYMAVKWHSAIVVRK